MSQDGDRISQFCAAIWWPTSRQWTYRPKDYAANWLTFRCGAHD